MPTLGELATTLELELQGDADFAIQRLAPLSAATAVDLSFVSEKKHLGKLADTLAGAVILHPDWAGEWDGNALLSDTPYVSYARATRVFDNHPQRSGGIHERAVIDEGAQLGRNVTIDVVLKCPPNERAFLLGHYHASGNPTETSNSPRDKNLRRQSQI